MNCKSKIALAALAFVSVSALAQTAPAAPASTLGFNVGVVSNYSFRGITQTNYGGAVQGGAEYSHSSGFYVGTWASNVNWVKEVNGATQGHYEVDLYGGYKGAITSDLSFDVGYITYIYPGNDSGAAGQGAGLYSNANTKEFYAGLSYGPVSFKINQSLGDFLGNIDSNGSRYYDLSATFDLGNGYSLVPHAGRQTVANQAGNVADYSDYALTLNKDLGNGLTVSATALTTSAGGFYVNQAAPAGDGKAIGKTAAVIGVKYAF